MGKRDVTFLYRSTMRSLFSAVNLSIHDLSSIIAAHASCRMTLGGMFLHITNHKTYHRGWVSEIFFEYDVNPPETDLCVYLCLE